jgi:hypothetical protein
MALEKVTVVDQVTVVENGTIQYREATRILEDGVQLSQTYHRTSIEKDGDLSNAPANVVAIANAAWTPEVVAAYQEQVAKVGA